MSHQAAEIIVQKMKQFVTCGACNRLGRAEVFPGVRRMKCLSCRTLLPHKNPVVAWMRGQMNGPEPKE